MLIVQEMTKLQETRTKLKKMETWTRETRARRGRRAGNVVPHDIPCFHTEILAQPPRRRRTPCPTTFLAGMSCGMTFYGPLTETQRDASNVVWHDIVPCPTTFCVQSYIFTLRLRFSWPAVIIFTGILFFSADERKPTNGGAQEQTRRTQIEQFILDSINLLIECYCLLQIHKFDSGFNLVDWINWLLIACNAIFFIHEFLYFWFELFICKHVWLIFYSRIKDVVD